MQRMTADDLAGVKVRAAKGSNAAVPDIATDAACVSDRPQPDGRHQQP
jgi:hypothetical protein